MRSQRVLGLTTLALMVAICVSALALQARSPSPPAPTAPSALSGPLRARALAEDYPYGSRQFDEFVIDSYRYRQSKNWRGFYAHMDAAYRRYRASVAGWGSSSLGKMLDAQNARLATLTDRSSRAISEMQFSSDLHRFVKTALPIFSLDRGFEFYYAHKSGERQCFLQSVLIAGMLQRAGINAGVAMVYRNIGGQLTNNGHAVDLVRLSNGRDIIVDASEPKPFAKQRGLFARQSDYAYVDPVFADHSAQIVRYRAAGDRRSIQPSSVKPLDRSFLQSQFWFYRGERSVGGLILLPKTASGLKRSEQALRTSVRLCPHNPLAVFTLARVYVAEGKKMSARETITAANELYRRFGWVPAGVREYLALLKAPGADGVRAARSSAIRSSSGMVTNR